MSTAKPKRLRELERDLLEARTEAALLRTRATLRRLKESAALSPDWVGPYADFLERRAMNPDWLPVGGSGARRGGANYPFYQTETELNILRDLSRVVAGTNNHAAGLLRGYTSFVAGTGFKCKVTPKPDSGPVGKAAAARVTAWLEGWEKRQRWAERQQELVRRTERDGDGILRLFADEDAGELGVRFVWPEQVVQPPDSTFEEWSFGLRTDPDDRETATEMYVAGVDNPADGDYVPARDFVLFQPENDSGVKRRVPTFAFGMREVLDSAGRLTRNLGEGAAVREAIAYMRQHAAAAESDIEAANFADAAYRERVPYTDTYRPVSISEPGTVVDFPEGMELAGVPANPGSAAHSAVVDLLIRSACARLNAPEWLGSSNAANMGAYTSSLVAESPFVKGVVQVQAYYRPRLLTVVDRALALAAAAGKVRREDLDAVTVDLIPPSPEVRNKLEEAQRFQVEQQLGVDSPQRYCESVDRDFERIAEENKRAKELAGPPPGAPGAPGQPPDAGGGDPLAALGGLAESLLSDDAVEEFGLRLLEADAPPGKVWKQVNYTRGGKQYTRKQLVNAPAAAAQKPAGKKDEPKAGPAKGAAVLTPEQKELLADYTDVGGEHFKAVNGLLRGADLNPEDAAKAKEIHAALQAAFAAEAKAPDPGTVLHRGESYSEADGAKVFDDAQRAMAAGEPVTRAGYTSTSADEATARDFSDDFEALGKPVPVMYRIKPARVLDMAPYSRATAQTGEESELLLDHNSRFRVTGVAPPGEPNKFGQRKPGVIEMEQVAATPAATPAAKAQPKPAAPAKAAKPDAAAVQKELLGHLENPAGLTPDVATALAGKLKTLTVPQVQAIQKAAGAKGGKDKAEKIARTLDAVRAKLAKAKEAPAGAPPETPAAPAAPPAANEQAAANVFHDMVGGRYANLGMVPVHEMRAAFKRANPGATDADFDNALLSLRRDDRARLIPIDDRSRATPDQLKNSIHRVGETFFYMQATPTTPAAANPPAPTGVPPETPPGPAAKPAPHAQARAALDALGVAHSHLSDEDVVSRLKAAFGAPAAKPAAKAKPAARPKAAAGRTKPAGEHLDAAAAELNALSRSDGAATVTDEAATAHLDRVLAGMTSDEVKEIARRVTNRRARTPAEARQNLHNDLTAVRRLVQSQNV